MPFIPLHDRNPRLVIAHPWTNWALIAATLTLFLWQSTVNEPDLARMIYGLGFIPIAFGGDAGLPPELALVPAWLTPITYQFLHGSWMHLGGNLLYLWVFGDNVEDAMGHWRFLFFYLACGTVAALAQFAALPQSEAPLVGASGAVSGVLGAYLILHPKAKVLVPIVIIPVYLPAWLLLIGWFGFQLFAGVSDGNMGGGVAWWAHVGGFLCGLVLVGLFRRSSTMLFGREDLPGGITTRDRSRRQRLDERRRGPWD